MKTRAEHGEPYISPDQKDNLTKENLLHDKSEAAGVKKNPLSHKEKHNRAIQSLVLMDSILEQASQFTAKERIVDFAKV